jgi:hypothetical protein
MLYISVSPRQAGCNSIYLEKPGAPTVKELEAMRDQAKTAGVTVLMGYNKNVCKFVSKGRDFQAANPGSHITFASNNAYENTPESLGECFERNSEGMLKNMAIHELALLVSFYEVTVENIAECIADKEFSSCQTLKGPSGKDFTDFDKIKFTIKTKTGKEVSVSADRCGGNVSFAKVEVDGKEVFRHSMPDKDDEANVAKLTEQYPGAMVRLSGRECEQTPPTGALFFDDNRLTSFLSCSLTFSPRIPTTLPSRSASP